MPTPAARGPVPADTATAAVAPRLRRPVRRWPDCVVALALSLAATAQNQDAAIHRREARLAKVALERTVAVDWRHADLGFGAEPADPTRLQVEFTGDASHVVVLLRPGQSAGRFASIALPAGTARQHEMVPDWTFALASAGEVRLQDRSGDFAFAPAEEKRRELPQIVDEGTLARSPDLQRIVTYDARRRVWLREVSKPEVKTRIAGSCDSIAFDRARGRIAVTTVCALDGGKLAGDRLTVYPGDGEPPARAQLTEWVRAVDWNVDGSAVLFADGKLKRFDVTTGKVLDGTRAARWLCVLDPVVGLGHDGRSVFVFDTVSLAAKDVTLAEAPKVIRAAAIDQERRRLALLTTAASKRSQSRSSGAGARFVARVRDHPRTAPTGEVTRCHRAGLNSPSKILALA